MITYIKPSWSRVEKPDLSEYKMHTHDYYEVLLFISGDADYTVEGNIYRLHPGDMMIMNKSESHHLVLRSDAPYERLVAHFNVDDEKIREFFKSKPSGKNSLYKAADIPDRWRFYLEKACGEGLHFYMLPLLYEMADMGLPKNDSITDKAQQIIEYINQNIQNELSLDTLCEKFYLSKAHLNRIFKKATGTTVWDYITVKRLFFARRQISHGTNPTDAYISSGFHDYTTFYRAYKKQFNEAPKAQKVRNSI